MTIAPKQQSFGLKMDTGVQLKGLRTWPSFNQPAGHLLVKVVLVSVELFLSGVMFWEGGSMCYVAWLLRVTGNVRFWPFEL